MASPQQQQQLGALLFQMMQGMNPGNATPAPAAMPTPQEEDIPLAARMSPHRSSSHTTVSNFPAIHRLGFCHFPCLGSTHVLWT